MIISNIPNTSIVTPTPTVSGVPIADSNKTINAWVTSIPTANGDASISATGIISVSGIAGVQMTMEGDSQRVFRSILTSPSTYPIVNSVAYFVYVGRSANIMTPKHVETMVAAAAGTGVGGGEVGIFSSPTAPSRAGQTLTKLVASNLLTQMTAINTVISNTTNFATAIPAGTEIWAGLRCSGFTINPTFNGLAGDFSDGYVLKTAAAPVFTLASSTTFVGALISPSGIITVAPDLRITLD